MSYTAPNPIQYQSVLQPITTFIMTVKRGDGATAGGGTATTVGTFLVENASFTAPGTEVRRKGTSGEGTDLGIVRNPYTFTGKVQIKTILINSIQSGDFFDLAFTTGFETPGTVDVLLHTFVIGSCTKDETAGTPWTYNLNAVEAMESSTAYGGSH